MNTYISTVPQPLISTSASTQSNTFFTFRSLSKAPTILKEEEISSSDWISLASDHIDIGIGALNVIVVAGSLELLLQKLLIEFINLPESDSSHFKQIDSVPSSTAQSLVVRVPDSSTMHVKVAFESFTVRLQLEQQRDFLAFSACALSLSLLSNSNTTQALMSLHSLLIEDLLSPFHIHREIISSSKMIEAAEGKHLVTVDFKSFTPQSTCYRGHKGDIKVSVASLKVIALMRFIDGLQQYLTRGSLPKLALVAIKTGSAFQSLIGSSSANSMQAKAVIIETEVFQAETVFVDLSLERLEVIIPQKCGDPSHMLLNISHIRLTNTIETDSIDFQSKSFQRFSASLSAFDVFTYMNSSSLQSEKVSGRILASLSNSLVSLNLYSHRPTAEVKVVATFGSANISVAQSQYFFCLGLVIGNFTETSTLTLSDQAENVITDMAFKTAAATVAAVAGEKAVNTTDISILVEMKSLTVSLQSEQRAKVYAFMFIIIFKFSDYFC